MAVPFFAEDGFLDSTLGEILMAASLFATAALRALTLAAGAWDFADFTADVFTGVGAGFTAFARAGARFAA
jgi:hypothetical protein